MNSKKHIQWLSLLIVFLVFFGFGQSAWAATWYSQGAVQLNSITNWYSTPSGSGGSALGSWVSTDKYVVQGTHVLTFAAATFDTLFIESTGNHITAGVTVNGVVSVKASCSPTAGGALDINGTLIVTNGSALTPAGNITCNKLIISDATMTVATLTTLDLDGDLILEGTSALTAGDDAAVVTMTGTSAQTITVSEDSYCEFGDLTINNTGGVTTSSNFTMRDLLTTTAGAFTATAGNITFNPLAASNLWAATAAITFNDLVLNLGFDGTPATDATINGNLTKIGASAFAPTAGTITFTNTNLSGKEMQLVGGTTSFLHLEISAGSKLKTSSNFTIGDPATTATAGSLVVGSSASLICEAGTVTIVSAAATLTNNGTLEFNNLTNDVTAVATATNSSFVIKGDFYNTTSGIFTATAGTITFQNTTQRTITNQNNAQAELVFWGLTIASNSDVTCGENITISGDLTLGSAAELTFTAGATHLDVAGDRKSVV